MRIARHNEDYARQREIHKDRSRGDKAVLVIEEPGRCEECPFCAAKDEQPECMVTQVVMNVRKTSRPYHCPLRSVPQKQRPDDDFAAGYNKCIDLISQEHKVIQKRTSPNIVAMRLGGSYKLCSHLSYNGDINGDEIWMTLRNLGVSNLKEAAAGLEWLGTDDTEAFAAEIRVRYNKAKDEFDTPMDAEKFIRSYPQYNKNISVDRLLFLIAQKRIRKVPDDRWLLKPEFMKSMKYAYIIDFDAGVIEQYEHGTRQEDIPLPEYRAAAE